MEETLTDELRVAIDTLIREKGFAYRDISRRIGKNNAYVYQFLFRGTPRTLPEEVRHALARELGVNEKILKRAPPATGEVRGSSLPVTARPTLGPRAGLASPFEGPRNLPLYEARNPGERDGVRQEVVEYVQRPFSLFGVGDGFAYRIQSDLYSPRYRPGDMLFFHPRQPVEPEDGVVLELEDGSRAFGIMVGRTDEHIVIKTVSPEKKERVALSKVKQLARETGVMRR